MAAARRRWRLGSGLITAALVVAGLVAGAAGASGAPARPSPAAQPGAPTRTTAATRTIPAGSTGTYTNPVGTDAAATFADPSMIRGKDGRWYAYGTNDPVRANVGDTSVHLYPTISSADMVHWRYEGDVFTADTIPAWLAGRARVGGFWAPDIRYIDGRYYLYYAATGPGFTVGVATAPTPTGPWTDSGGPVIPDKGACDTFTDIDPAQYDGTDGHRYLLWGSFKHLCTMELSADATRTVGAVHTVYAGDAEGAYIVHRDGYYYLFVSENGCCGGAWSSYQVRVGRSRSPIGPFRDRAGTLMTSTESRGTFVMASNGNRWMGPGGLGVSTDLSGQDWMVYHALPRDQAPPTGIGANIYRPMLIDRLDWIDGWPTVRGGAGPSQGPQRAPVTTFGIGGGFTPISLRRDWSSTGGRWTLTDDSQTGAAARAVAGAGARPSQLLTRRSISGPLRAEADLRVGAGARAGLVVSSLGRTLHATAWLDSRRRALVTELDVAGVPIRRQSTPLPADFAYDTWHSLSAEVDRGRVLVQVTGDRQETPIATTTLRLTVPFVGGGSVGVAAADGSVAAANVGATALYRTGRAVTPPRIGPVRAGYSDEFTGPTPGTTADSPWSWVRGPSGSSTDGQFGLPTQGDIWAGAHDAAVLLRDAPTGDYTVTTQLRFDGTVAPQQAGLIAYASDDQWIRLTDDVGSAEDSQGVRHETQFAHEDDPGAHPTAWMDVGPPGATTWLRMIHRTDPTSGTPTWRAATSRDGRHWVLGGTWWLPKGVTPRIGLVGLGPTGATAHFDYFRVATP